MASRKIHEHTAIEIGKNCNPRPDTDLFSLLLEKRREENTWNYFKKASCENIFDESNDR